MCYQKIAMVTKLQIRNIFSIKSIFYIYYPIKCNQRPSRKRTEKVLVLFVKAQIGLKIPKYILPRTTFDWKRLGTV
jgi:hypothetical protein